MNGTSVPEWKLEQSAWGHGQLGLWAPFVSRDGSSPIIANLIPQKRGCCSVAPRDTSVLPDAKWNWAFYSNYALDLAVSLMVELPWVQVGCSGNTQALTITHDTFQ